MLLGREVVSLAFDEQQKLSERWSQRIEYNKVQQFAYMALTSDQSLESTTRKSFLSKLKDMNAILPGGLCRLRCPPFLRDRTTRLGIDPTTRAS